MKEGRKKLANGTHWMTVQLACRKSPKHGFVIPYRPDPLEVYYRATDPACMYPRRNQCFQGVSTKCIHMTDVNSSVHFAEAMVPMRIELIPYTIDIHSASSFINSSLRRTTMSQRQSKEGSISLSSTRTRRHPTLIKCSRCDV